jgi:hypothetical protein
VPQGEQTPRFGDVPIGTARDTGVRAGPDNLTRAEARALSRCAPLTPAEFKAHGRDAEQSVDPLRTVLTGFGGAARGSAPEQR